jgi:hypothetical protein
VQGAFDISVTQMGEDAGAAKPLGRRLQFCPKFYIYFLTYLLVCLILAVLESEIQGLSLARQVLYHLSHAPSHFWF